MSKNQSSGHVEADKTGRHWLLYPVILCTFTFVMEVTFCPAELICMKHS